MGEYSERNAAAAAEELDAPVTRCPTRREQVRDRGLVVDRSPHRGPHLDDVEGTLGNHL